MSEVGHILRKAREEKGLDLKEIEQSLKIRRKFLIALENDEAISDLGEIYVKGFLRSYALYLELDPDHILQIYGTGPAPAPVSRQHPAYHSGPVAPAFSAMVSQKQAKAPRPRWLVVMFSLGGIFVGAAMLLLVFGVFRGADSLPASEAQAALTLTQEIQLSSVVSDTASSQTAPLDTPSPTSTPTLTATPTATPTITPTPTPEFYTGVNIELLASANAWTQIRVDGKKVFEGMLEPGMRKHWRGEDRVEVRCGNAGGVEAFVNGESIGLLGEDGQVVDMEWQKEKNAAVEPGPAPEEVVPVATVEVNDTPAAAEPGSAE